MKKISIVYEIARFFVAIAHKLFYKKIIVEGRENIPAKGALIFAPNHQNALMDALAIMFTNNRLTVFLARADIFKNKLSAWILTELKILPVYRQRDGKDSLEKNEEIFNKTVEVLEYKTCLCLFPESQHTNKRCLQQLKKGVQRIAFQTEEMNNYSLDLKIIPTGIYYSNYQPSGSILMVKYGKPISMSDYRELYIQNNQKAMLKLRDDMTSIIKPLIIDIQNVEYYEMIESLREIYYIEILNKLNLPINYKNKFIADKKLIELLNTYIETYKEDAKNLDINVKTYNEKLKEAKLEDKAFNYSKSLLFYIFKSILLAVLSLLFAFVYVINIIPYHIPKIFIKNVKDLQFHSSFKFVLGLIMFPLYYIIVTSLVFIFSDYTYLNIFISVFLWFSLYIFFRLKERFKSMLLYWRYIKIKKFNPSTYNDLKSKRDEIIKVLDIIYKE